MEDYEFGPDVWAEVEAGLARLGSEPIATSDDEHMPDSEASFSQRSLASSGYVSDDGGQVQRSQFSVAMCKHLQQSFHQRVSRVTAELSDLLKPANPSAEAQLADDADNEAVTVSIRSSTPTGLPAARMTAANGTGLEAGAWVEPVVPLPPSALVPAMEQTHQHMAQPERCAQPPPPDNACASVSRQHPGTPEHIVHPPPLQHMCAPLQPAATGVSMSARTAQTQEYDERIAAETAALAEEARAAAAQRAQREAMLARQAAEAQMREAERVDLQRKMLALQLAYMRKRIAAGRIARAWKRYLSSPARAHKLAAVARIQAAARGCSARLLAHQLRQRRDALGALEQAAKSGQRDALEVAAKQAEALGLGQDAGRKLQAFELSARTAQHELKRTAQHGIQAEFEAALGRAMVFAHMGGLVAEAQAAFAKRRRDAEAALVASLQDEPATIIKRLLTVAASLGVSQQHLESCSNAVAQRDADAVADLRSAAAASPFSGEQMRRCAFRVRQLGLQAEAEAGEKLLEARRARAASLLHQRAEHAMHAELGQLITEARTLGLAGDAVAAAHTLLRRQRAAEASLIEAASSGSASAFTAAASIAQQLNIAQQAVAAATQTFDKRCSQAQAGLQSAAESGSMQEFEAARSLCALLDQSGAVHQAETTMQARRSTAAASLSQSLQQCLQHLPLGRLQQALMDPLSQPQSTTSLAIGSAHSTEQAYQIPDVASGSLEAAILERQMSSWGCSTSELSQPVSSSSARQPVPVPGATQQAASKPSRSLTAQPAAAEGACLLMQKVYAAAIAVDGLAARMVESLAPINMKQEARQPGGVQDAATSSQSRIPAGSSGPSAGSGIYSDSTWLQLPQCVSELMQQLAALMEACQAANALATVAAAGEHVRMAHTSPPPSTDTPAACIASLQANLLTAHLVGLASTLASALQIMRQHLAVELAAGSGLVAHGTLSLDDAQDEYEAGALPHDSSSSSDDPGRCAKQYRGLDLVAARLQGSLGSSGNTLLAWPQQLSLPGLHACYLAWRNKANVSANSSTGTASSSTRSSSAIAPVHQAAATGSSSTALQTRAGSWGGSGLQRQPRPSSNGSLCHPITAALIQANAPGCPLSQLLHLDLGLEGVTDLANLGQLCPQLTSLAVNCNQLCDMHGILSCSALVELKLKKNRIPVIAGLRVLQQLRHLDLSDNDLTSMDGLQHCACLEQLELRHNQIASIGDALVGCTALTSIDLAVNKLTSLEGLGVCPGLQHLSVIDNDLTSLDGLQGCSRLTSITAHRNLFEAFPLELPSVMLRELRLADNWIPSIPVLPWLPHLEELDLSNNAVTSIGPLHGLPNLRRLNLALNKLPSLDSLAALTPLSHLAALYLGDNPVAGLPGYARAVRCHLPNVTLEGYSEELGVARGGSQEALVRAMQSSPLAVPHYVRQCRMLSRPLFWQGVPHPQQLAAFARQAPFQLAQRSTAAAQQARRHWEVSTAQQVVAAQQAERRRLTQTYQALRLRCFSATEPQPDGDPTDFDKYGGQLMAELEAVYEHASMQKEAAPWLYNPLEGRVSEPLPSSFHGYGLRLAAWHRHVKAAMLKAHAEQLRDLDVPQHQVVVERSAAYDRLEQAAILRRTMQIQAAWRGYHARKLAARLARDRLDVACNSAAARIQAAWRGRSVRCDADLLARRAQAAEHRAREAAARKAAAAVRIQAAVRGLRVRRRFKAALQTARYVDDDDFSYDGVGDDFLPTILSGLDIHDESPLSMPSEKSRVLQPGLSQQPSISSRGLATGSFLIPAHPTGMYGSLSPQHAMPGGQETAQAWPEKQPSTRQHQQPLLPRLQPPDQRQPSQPSAPAVLASPRAAFASLPPVQGSATQPTPWGSPPFGASVEAAGVQMKPRGAGSFQSIGLPSSQPALDLEASSVSTAAANQTARQEERDRRYREMIEKLMGEWGFKDWATAEAYYKARQRQLRQQSNSKQRLRMQDPQVRLAKFKQQVELRPEPAPSEAAHARGARPSQPWRSTSLQEDPASPQTSPPLGSKALHLQRSMSDGGPRKAAGHERAMSDGGWRVSSAGLGSEGGASTASMASLRSTRSGILPDIGPCARSPTKAQLRGGLQPTGLAPVPQTNGPTPLVINNWVASPTRPPPLSSPRQAAGMRQGGSPGVAGKTEAGENGVGARSSRFPSFDAGSQGQRSGQLPSRALGKGQQAVARDHAQAWLSDMRENQSPGQWLAAMQPGVSPPKQPGLAPTQLHHSSSRTNAAL